MPYSSMLLHVGLNLDSLAARTEDLSRRFFPYIMDPASWLHSRLPLSRSNAITSKLRSSQIIPISLYSYQALLFFYTIRLTLPVNLLSYHGLYLIICLITSYSIWSHDYVCRPIWSYCSYLSFFSCSYVLQTVWLCFFSDKFYRSIQLSAV